MSPSEPKHLSWGQVGLKLICIAWAAVVVPVALVLVFVALTASGRLFGCGGVLLGLLPLAAVQTRSTGARFWRILLILCVGGFTGSLVTLAIRSPRGKRTGTRVHHEYNRGLFGFQRLAIGNLLPENDQLRLIATLAPAFDRRLTSAQASEFKGLAAAVYGELETDPDFHALGSVMTRTYADLAGIRTPGEHAYVYVPPNLDPKTPAPLLIFFHGTGGNFKGYLWVLSRLADRAGFVLVAPSNGTGRWRGLEAVTTHDLAYTAASRWAKIDPRRVTAVGLYSGGQAVSQLAALRGSQLSAMIFISPIFNEREVASPGFADQCRRRPVLVLTGGADDRTPVEYVERNVATMTAQGARVRLSVLPDAGHFLILSHRTQLEKEIEEWLQRVEHLHVLPEEM